jgi:hypothetical protein
MAGVKGRSGGYRSGSGRRALGGPWAANHGRREPVVRPVTPTAEKADQPAGLTPEEAAIWEKLAPHATKAGTLVPQTADAFGRLCRAMVTHARMEAQIAEDGLTFVKVTVDGAGQEQRELKAHPLLSRAASLDNAIKAGLKDFALNPFGKPLVDPNAQAVDPFDAFEQVG